MLNWLSMLPDRLVRARPLLCTIHALALLLTNQLAATEARLQDAERGIRPDTSTDQVQIIQGRAAVLRAILVRYSGDFAGCVAFAAVDAGPVMAAMLRASDARGVAPDYISRLLAAFPRTEGQVLRTEQRSRSTLSSMLGPHHSWSH